MVSTSARQCAGPHPEKVGAVSHAARILLSSSIVHELGISFGTVALGMVLGGSELIRSSSAAYFQSVRMCVRRRLTVTGDFPHSSNCLIHATMSGFDRSFRCSSVLAC